MPKQLPHICLTGDPLDRLDAIRKNPDALQKILEHADALYLVVQGDQVLLNQQDELALVHRDILPHLQVLAPGPILLGVEPKSGKPWFVISPDPEHQSGQELLNSLGNFVPLRQSLVQLPAADLAIVGRSFSLLRWHENHLFCAGCGQPSVVSAGGEKRTCADCQREHFPRVDPAVIMMVVQGENCLLGRNASWPDGHYSTLAGFVEPGESLEEACRREVMEEVGITISKVRYMFSQPWPFPHSLMIGLVAEATSTKIILEDELEDARWFNRQDIQAILAGTHPDVLPPYPQAASGVLIKTWAEQKS
ncbi:NADH pyrophosphatase, decaps 5'-NAD modified RNA [hydrothermal vent metagenome]|uniref:NAD(+) diphosphatase n=1 Tax=hydrothermal vent metagenome TaxID=652676 RepID=A0A3B0R7Y3_9ZZZZ